MAFAVVPRKEVRLSIFLSLHLTRNHHIHRDFFSITPSNYSFRLWKHLEKARIFVLDWDQCHFIDFTIFTQASFEIAVFLSILIKTQG